MNLFSKVLDCLTPPLKKTLGLQLKQELDDCAKKIMAIFEITEYDRDYENVWEWIEGCNKSGLQINISRSHGGQKGNYDKPIIIGISGSPKFLVPEKITEYSQRLAEVLQTEIWIGDVVIPKKDDRDYYFEIEERIAP